jgi:hypothetical protein
LGVSAYQRKTGRKPRNPPSPEGGPRGRIERQDRERIEATIPSARPQGSHRHAMLRKTFAVSVLPRIVLVWADEVGEIGVRVGLKTLFDRIADFGGARHGECIKAGLRQYSENAQAKPHCFRMVGFSLRPSCGAFYRPAPPGSWVQNRPCGKTRGDNFRYNSGRPSDPRPISLRE